MTNPQEVLEDLEALKIAGLIAELENLNLQFTKLKYELDHCMRMVNKLKGELWKK